MVRRKLKVTVAVPTSWWSMFAWIAMSGDWKRGPAPMPPIIW